MIVNSSSSSDADGDGVELTCGVDPAGLTTTTPVLAEDDNIQQQQQQQQQLQFMTDSDGVHHAVGAPVVCVADYNNIHVGSDNMQYFITVDPLSVALLFNSPENMQVGVNTNNSIGECNPCATAPTNSDVVHDDEPVRGRKRLRRESEWKQNICKRLHNSGHEYTASNGKVVERRQLKLHKCGQCANKCNERLSDDARQQIFTNFWSMADRSRQRDYL